MWLLIISVDSFCQNLSTDNQTRRWNIVYTWKQFQWQFSIQQNPEGHQGQFLFTQVYLISRVSFLSQVVCLCIFVCQMYDLAPQSSELQESVLNRFIFLLFILWPFSEATVKIMKTKSNESHSGGSKIFRQLYRHHTSVLL